MIISFVCFTHIHYLFIQKENLDQFNEFEWLNDMNLFGEQVSSETLSAAEVPQLPVPQANNSIYYRSPKLYTPNKKPRIAMPDDDEEEYFTVPDLG